MVLVIAVADLVVPRKMPVMVLVIAVADLVVPPKRPVSHSGGRPSGSTQEAGYGVSSGRPSGTTQEAGYSLVHSRGRQRDIQFHESIVLPEE